MTKKILYCRCSYANKIPKETEQEIFKILHLSDAEIFIVSDLCKLCAQKDSFLSSISQENFFILACHPRAIRSLFYQAGCTLQDSTLVLNLCKERPENILQKINLTSGTPSFQEMQDTGEWIPWFPTIDYQRCHNCKQCMNFCLFGVYEINQQGKVEVVKPQNCKNNCPACARICPDIAIIFPKYNQEPLDGAEILDEEKERARAKENIETMLGDDPYQALLQRRRKKAKISLLKEQK